MENLKEWLNTETYEHKLARTKPDGDWVSIPDGAIEARMNAGGGIDFINANEDYMNKTTKGEWVGTHRGKHDAAGHPIVWQREQDEPFLTPETTLNDQYAEIEEVRQALKDNVNHPSHYTQGKVECIDALESATIGKSGIEAVCVANVIKYLWRYEEKNGLEDIKKAQFYLNRLITTLEHNNG